MHPHPAILAKGFISYHRQAAQVMPTRNSQRLPAAPSIITRLQALNRMTGALRMP